VFVPFLQNFSTTHTIDLDELLRAFQSHGVPDDCSVPEVFLNLFQVA
jgi:hypothetical protein